MSKRLKNSILIFMITSLITSSSLTLLADTTTSAALIPNASNTPVASTTVTNNEPLKETSTNTAGYIPPNCKSETIYVNLDYYGLPTETQVVNGYRIDGNSKIVDYGTYTHVTNLTDYTVPTINNDQITWALPEDITTFYYQGTLEQVDLPWYFTIRYKLNGVETKAEDLAGASGMIETIIDIKPNPNVSDYLTNNFFLQLSTSYDMGKCLSVEAPEGVDVTLGATKSITFMAMPGEETSFHLYVGTDSYESTGFNVVIAPLQMAALNEVDTLKEVKGRLENAFDAANDSLDVILDSTNSIQSGLTELNQSISSMQDSLKAIRKEDAATDEKIEGLISTTNTLNESLQALSPHLETSQSFIQEINQTGNILVSDLQTLSPLLSDTKACLEALQSDCSSLNELVEALSEDGEKINTNLEPLRKQLLELSSDLHSLDNALSNLGFGLNSSQSSLDDASDKLLSLTIQLGHLTDSLTPEQIIYLVEQGYITMEQVDTLQNLDGLGGNLNDMSDMLSNTGALAGDSSDLITVLREVSTDVASLSAQLEGITKNLQALNTTLLDHTDTFVLTSNDLSILLENLGSSTDTISQIITDIDTTQNVINNYVPELTSFLQDSNILITSLSDTTTAATDLGSQVHNRVTTNRQHTYDSIDHTLSATMQTFDEIIHSLNNTDEVKQNKDIIKNTIEDEWAQLDEDFNLLDYDSEATPISLVSDKNTNVNSIQIILRTPEITVDKKAEILATQTKEEDLSIWDRIKKIFDNMF